MPKMCYSGLLCNIDFTLEASNFGDLAAFRAIFSYTFTVHAKKQLSTETR